MMEVESYPESFFERVAVKSVQPGDLMGFAIPKGRYVALEVIGVTLFSDGGAGIEYRIPIGVDIDSSEDREIYVGWHEDGSPDISAMDLHEKSSEQILVKIMKQK